MLALPLLAWTATGAVFSVKPGYDQAFEQLSFKTYPFDQNLVVNVAREWDEVSLLRTILGQHLLVGSNGQYRHLDPVSLQDKKPPTHAQLKQLIADALSNNPQRYGEVISVDGDYAKTSTGIEIKVDWLRLKISQKGRDTKFINNLYKIHYLQWTPFKGLNQFIGMLGLFMLASLTACGVWLYLASRA